MRLDINDKQIKMLDVYRRNRKVETGKMMTRNTAANEVLAKALEGVKDVCPSSLADLVKRVERLEYHRGL